MRIVFMGSPDFSVPTLRAIHNSPHEVVAVYSQPPRKSGRGKKQQPTPVHQFANANGIETFTPLNFQQDTDIDIFKKHNADLAIVIAYGLILPTEILDAPKYGCVNLHASLLPRWRGAAPIHRAIMSGDEKTGVCLMRMEVGLDTGPIYARSSIDLPFGTTAGELHDTLSELSANLLMENINKISQKKPVAQSEFGVTYAHKIQKSETAIDWKCSHIEVANFIHGLSPFPGAWSTHRLERIKFHQVELTNKSAVAGEIIDGQLTIGCGEGSIRPKLMQREGKKALAAIDVLNGLEFNIGEKLGEFD